MCLGDRACRLTKRCGSPNSKLGTAWRESVGQPKVSSSFKTAEATSALRRRRERRLLELDFERQAIDSLVTATAAPWAVSEIHFTPGSESKENRCVTSLGTHLCPDSNRFMIRASARVSRSAVSFCSTPCLGHVWSTSAVTFVSPAFLLWSAYRPFHGRQKVRILHSGILCPPGSQVHRR